MFYAKSGFDYLSNWGSNNRNVTADNNLYYGASDNATGDWGDDNAIFEDPMLEDPQQDMHIQDGSPGIGAAAELSADTAGTVDVDGEDRVIGSAADVGADEYDDGSVFIRPSGQKNIQQGLLIQEKPLGNSMRSFSIRLSQRTFLRIGLYGINGRKLRQLANGWKKAGMCRINYRTNGLSSGIYFYKIEAGDVRFGKKYVLIR